MSTRELIRMGPGFAEEEEPGEDDAQVDTTPGGKGGRPGNVDPSKKVGG